MTDAFLATVESYDLVLKTAKVKPLITENDGTKHPGIEVKPVAGILPAAGDLVLIVTIRNNLDDSFISRFFSSSESNGRIVQVVKPADGVFTFKGDYKFEGDVEFKGDVTITGDVSIEGDVSLKGDAAIEGNVTVTINGEDHEIKSNPVTGLPDVIQTSSRRTAFTDSFMTAFGPTVSRIPNGGP